MKTEGAKRGHLFQMFANTDLGIPMGFVSLGAYDQSSPVWHEQYLKLKFTDLRKELPCGGWSCSCVATNFNNFMLVYIKWNFGSWRSLHNQNQLMPALTVSAKKSWSESPRSGINNFKTLLQHWLNFMEGLNGNNIELESLELGLLLQSLTCQCQTRRDTQKQMLQGPSSACAVPAP